MVTLNFGQLIKEARVKKGFSQQKLSSVLGYKNGQIFSNIERGCSMMPVVKFKQLADCLEISVDILKESYLKTISDQIDRITKEVG